MKFLDLNNDMKCLVDDDTYKKYSHLKWYLSTNGYAMRREQPDGRGGMHVNKRLHRLIIKAKDNEFVDHINGDKLDNRRVNLRICTKAENAMNAGIPINNTSGFKGVRWIKGIKKWESRIARKHSSYFDSKFEAAKAYNKKAKELFGEFAFQNQV